MRERDDDRSVYFGGTKTKYYIFIVTSTRTITIGARIYLSFSQPVQTTRVIGE